MFIGNEEHYDKVIDARKNIGLDTHGIRQVDIPNSAYLNKHITDKSTQKTYLVERDYKEYSHHGFGWYKVMLLNCNGSHRVIVYENINNEEDDILLNTIKNQENFDFKKN